jgi:quercetin 2,3-dioxygenase
MKKIKELLNPPNVHMVGDGFRVHNFFPSGYKIAKEMSPFYLLDYNSEYKFPPSNKQRGVGPHPHRGFETVTIAYKGKIAHHDSKGNHGIIGEGDVQWMTAGSGILHKEYHEKNYSKTGGPFQMVQLWVNLPAKYKMTKPKYQELVHANMGKHPLDNNNGIVNVIAGTYKETKGPAETFSPIDLLDIRLEADAFFEINIKKNYNAGFLLIDGEIEINEEKTIHRDQFVLFEKTGSKISVKSKKKSIILVLSGESIDEPIAQYGPFLMNTREEIDKAIKDFNAGKFGYLKD